MTSPSLEFAPVTPERWADFVRLFERRGSPHYCWCMAWRRVPSELRDRPDTKRAAIEARALAGEPIGILAYLEGDPVAWCSVAPRDTHRPLGGDDYPEGTSVWSITCFFAMRELRGTGIAGRLLSAACDRATDAGADVIEAYPVDPESPSYRFMGLVPAFLAAGFEETGTAGTRRRVMRKLLT